MAELRQYAVSDTIYFPLVDATTGDYYTGVAPVAGDVRVTKDGATNSNTTNLPTIIPTSSGLWKIVLTATELTAKVICLWVVDATPTKLWKDQCIIIDTYGNVSAQHALNLNAAMRGTDGANTTKTGYSISGTKTTLDALNDIAATAIVSGGAINTTTGAVDTVTTVATTTTNTDMRGTDGANTVVPNTIAPQTAQQIRNAMKLSPAAGAPSAGSVDEHLDNIPTTGTDGDIVRGGTAQGGSVSTITLDAGASATNGNYDNDLVVITGGTGAGQSESVSSYVGATKVATMAANWKTAPDNTSVFSVYGRGTVAGATAPTTAQIADAVLDELMSGHDVAGSLAAAIRDVVERIAGNLELDRTTHKLVIKNAADATTRYTLQTREKPTDANVQEVVRT